MMLLALLQALSMLHLYHMQLLQAMEAIIMLRRSPRYWLWPLPLGARALAAAARRLLLSCQRRTPACLPAGSGQAALLSSLLFACIKPLLILR